MSDFVADANTTFAWLVDEEEHRDRMPADFDQATIVVPWLWRVELCNAVLKNERRKKFTQAQATRLQIIDAMQVEVVSEPTHRSVEALALFARPHQLTSYDALYLELAITLGLPLCSLDRNLQNAARRSGVDLIIGYERTDGS